MDIQVKMGQFWSTNEQRSNLQREFVDALHRGQDLNKNANWRGRMKAALARMRKDARSLASIPHAPPQAASLLHSFKLVQHETEVLNLAYLRFMATDSSPAAQAMVASNNRLTSYMNTANQQWAQLK